MLESFVFTEFRPVVFKTKDNIARALLGERLGAVIGDLDFTSPQFASLLVLMWMIGATVVFLPWFKAPFLSEWAKDSTLVVGSLMTVPMVVVCGIPAMNVKMVKELFSSYEVLFNTFNLMMFSVGFQMRYYDRPVMIFTLMVGFWPTVLTLPFFDALPNALRTRVSAIALAFGIVWCAVFGLGLYFNLFQEENASVTIGNLDFTAESMMANALVNLFCLFIKFLRAALYFPDEMTVSYRRARTYILFI